MGKFPTEATEQRALIKWSKYHPIAKYYLMANGNGGSRQSPREGANLKAQGLKAGVSDLFLAYPVNGKHGLWIELKRRKGKSSQVSKAQWDWLELMGKVGYGVALCYGWDEAREAILEYLDET